MTTESVLQDILHATSLVVVVSARCAVFSDYSRNYRQNLIFTMGIYNEDIPYVWTEYYDVSDSGYLYN